jgi:peptidoglycan/LPS O-acetylase OafA/YrhL
VRQRIPAAGSAGRVSYSTYLWHFPVFAATVAPLDFAAPGVFRMYLAAMFLVGAASYRWIEAPAKTRDPRLAGPSMARECSRAKRWTGSQVTTWRVRVRFEEVPPCRAIQNSKSLGSCLLFQILRMLTVRSSSSTS